jgi:acylphosphatase
MKSTIYALCLITFSLTSCSKEKVEADRADSILNLLNSSHITLNGSMYDAALDTLLNGNNDNLPSGTVECKVATLNNDDVKKLQKLVSEVDDVTIKTFDDKIKKWINLWNTGKTSWYSDPAHILLVDSKEYQEYITFCIGKGKTIFPLIFELLSKTDKCTHFYFLSYPLVADILPKMPEYQKYVNQAHESYLADYGISGYKAGEDPYNEILFRFMHNVLNSEF